MTHRMFIFTRPPNGGASLTIDTGWSGTAYPATDPDGRPGVVFDIPDTVPDRVGADLWVEMEGKQEIHQRGLIIYLDDRAYLGCDDFILTDLPPDVPPVPPDPEPLPPGSQDPIDYINAVYATGDYNLATIQGCGKFTEACCNELAKNLGLQWGHVAKSQGQNQYNNHAVDALMCLFGEYDGIWDIIYSSASSQAKPVFNDAGDTNPEIWRPAQPLPVSPAGTKGARRHKGYLSDPDRFR